MRCEQCRDLLLTDHIDGQLSTDEQRRIEAHVTGCERCREFSQAVRQAAVEPLKKLDRVHPSPAVWENIKERIEGRTTSSGFLEKIKEWIDGFFPQPQPALALASGLVVLLIVASLIPPLHQRVQKADVEIQEQIEYVASVVDEEDIYGSEPEGNGYYDTGFGGYFL